MFLSSTYLPSLLFQFEFESTSVAWTSSSDALAHGLCRKKASQAAALLQALQMHLGLPGHSAQLQPSSRPVPLNSAVLAASCKQCHSLVVT